MQKYNWIELIDDPHKKKKKQTNILKKQIASQREIHLKQIQFI